MCTMCTHCPKPLPYKIQAIKRMSYFILTLVGGVWHTNHIYGAFPCDKSCSAIEILGVLYYRELRNTFPHVS